LRYLKSLYLENNRISDADIEVLKKSLPSCYISHLGNMPIPDDVYIDLNKYMFTLVKGETDNIIVTGSTGNENGQSLLFLSSNSSVATVDNTGKITAVIPGTAVISVLDKRTAATANCLVTVAIPSSSEGYNAKYWVERTQIQKSFYSFNKAYEAILQIKDVDEQAYYLGQLAPLWEVVATKEVINIFTKVEECRKTYSKALYEDVFEQIGKSTVAEEDKALLLLELNPLLNMYYDTNEDNEVNEMDIDNIVKNYNKSKSDMDWQEQYDHNVDGIIDIYDLAKLSKKIN
jgi:hypothetical protein